MLTRTILTQSGIECIKSQYTEKRQIFHVHTESGRFRISALAPVISELLSTKTKEAKEMLGNLWDVAQLLAEVHHSQTIARRACILPSVSKQMSEQLTKRKLDKYLFGENLCERIKEIKMINKIGQEMKSQPPKVITTQKASNWKGPSVPQKSATQAGYKQHSQQPRKPTSKELSSTRRSSYPRSNQFRAQAHRPRH